MFRLENEAAQLGRRIGALSKEAAPPVTRPPRRPEELSGAAPTAASGGPLLAPLPEPSASRSALDAQLSRVEGEIASVADATAQRSIELMRLPTRLPIEGAELTSTFGNRTDPFNHVSAFHAGLDFAAAYGTPIVAAAGGTVAFAGFKGDFGWVVEIDHGNGLLTRYAHGFASCWCTPARSSLPAIASRWSARPAVRPARICTSRCSAAVRSTPARYLAGL